MNHSARRALRCIVLTPAKGAYAGLSLAEAVITPDGDANQAYYGGAASPADVLVHKSVDSPSSASLPQPLSGMVR